jgi:hypothetical protein
MTEPTPPVQTTIHLELTPQERDLLLAAIKLLRSTLGHEEAEELAEVKALLTKLGG